MNLDGARVLLTGATGGLGQEIARRLHRAGAVLTLTGRRADVLAPLAAETGAEFVACDLGDRGSVTALADRVGDIDVLVANAALPGTGRLTEMDPERIDANLEVNLRAPIQLTHALLPGMLERGQGHFVYIGSIAGLVSSPGSALYNASKFGLRGFAHGLRQDLHGSGVGVSVLHPGFVRDTGMFADSGMELPPGVRTVSPDDVARAVVSAIVHDRGEMLVAPVEMRWTARLGSIAPGLSAAIQRRAGAAEIVGNHAGKD